MAKCSSYGRLHLTPSMHQFIYNFNVSKFHCNLLSPSPPLPSPPLSPPLPRVCNKLPASTTRWALLTALPSFPHFPIFTGVSLMTAAVGIIVVTLFWVGGGRKRKEWVSHEQGRKIFVHVLPFPFFPASLPPFSFLHPTSAKNEKSAWLWQGQN